MKLNAILAALRMTGSAVMTNMKNVAVRRERVRVRVLLDR
jgi:hypothetical protein